MHLMSKVYSMYRVPLCASQSLSHALHVKGVFNVLCPFYARQPLPLLPGTIPLFHCFNFQTAVTIKMANVFQFPGHGAVTSSEKEKKNGISHREAAPQNKP